MLVAILQDIAFGQLDHQLLYRVHAEPVIMQVMQQEAVGEVAGSDVNGDMKLAVAGKSIQTAGGFGNDVAGEGDDQIVPFGDGNKHLRRNRSAARVVPAQQDLHPAAAAAARILQRLAPEGKLPGGNTEAYLPREAHSSGGGQPGDTGH